MEVSVEQHIALFKWAIDRDVVPVGAENIAVIAADLDSELFPEWTAETVSLYFGQFYAQPDAEDSVFTDSAAQTTRRPSRRTSKR